MAWETMKFFWAAFGIFGLLLPGLSIVCLVTAYRLERKSYKYSIRKGKK